MSRWHCATAPSATQHIILQLVGERSHTICELLVVSAQSECHSWHNYWHCDAADAHSMMSLDRRRQWTAPRLAIQGATTSPASQRMRLRKLSNASGRSMAPSEALPTLFTCMWLSRSHVSPGRPSGSSMAICRCQAGSMQGSVLQHLALPNHSAGLASMLL